MNPTSASTNYSNPAIPVSTNPMKDNSKTHQQEILQDHLALAASINPTNNQTNQYTYIKELENFEPEEEILEQLIDRNCKIFNDLIQK
ncbi:8099_t:CDS:2 [Gigaspora margarita]|uniref:8099_t:CDS:1 n=1 Tax=Gigaspora margarita TaxID=4874 RepID=A0ABN7W8S6_GIGMA|nr:8099_t:CDS:2 [Gigaspora margarita]